MNAEFAVHAKTHDHQWKKWKKSTKKKNRMQSCERKWIGSRTTASNSNVQNKNQAPTFDGSSHSLWLSVSAHRTLNQFLSIVSISPRFPPAYPRYLFRKHTFALSCFSSSSKRNLRIFFSLRRFLSHWKQTNARTHTHITSTISLR